MSSSNSVSAPDSVLRAHGLDDSCVDPEIRQERQDRELTIRMKYGDYMVSEELKSKLQQITQQEVYKMIVSKPSDKAAKYRKIEIEKNRPVIRQQRIRRNRFFMKK